MIKDIYNKIRKARIEKDYSQEFMAERLHISQSYYSKIENGNKKVTVEQIVEICILLEIKLALLFESLQD